MKSISEKYGKKEIQISDESRRIMENYNWPGNVRELENVVELIIGTESFPTKYFIKNSGQESQDLFAIVSEQEKTSTPGDRLENLDPSQLEMSFVEKQHISKVLELFEGNISQAAQALGIQRNTLYSKIKKYQIEI